MAQNRTLTDLLNADAAAYQFFYGLPPQTQTLLQDRPIRTLEELHRAVDDLAVERRPKAF